MATKTRHNRDWSHELATFEDTNHKTRTFTLSSPGVAQVTRCRIIRSFDTPVAIRTVGARLIFEK